MFWPYNFSVYHFWKSWHDMELKYLYIFLLCYCTLQQTTQMCNDFILHMHKYETDGEHTWLSSQVLLRGFSWPMGVNNNKLKYPYVYFDPLWFSNILLFQNVIIIRNRVLRLLKWFMNKLNFIIFTKFGSQQHPIFICFRTSSYSIANVEQPAWLFKNWRDIYAVTTPALQHPVAHCPTSPPFLRAHMSPSGQPSAVSIAKI